MSENVKTKIKGSILEVTLDRPKANAVDLATSRELGDIFADFRDNPELRVAIITGAGEKFFCPGWDLKAAADGEDGGGREEGSAVLKTCHDLRIDHLKVALQ